MFNVKYIDKATYKDYGQINTMAHEYIINYFNHTKINLNTMFPVDNFV